VFTGGEVAIDFVSAAEATDAVSIAEDVWTAGSVAAFAACTGALGAIRAMLPVLIPIESMTSAPSGSR
jgi:hypothetical protein